MRDSMKDTLAELEESALNLLIGKDSLRTLGATIDFELSSTFSERLGMEPTRLHETAQGHSGGPGPCVGAAQRQQLGRRRPRASGSAHLKR